MLPKKDIKIETLEFSPEEREARQPIRLSNVHQFTNHSIQIYDDFERKAKVKVNRFIREGTFLKKFVPTPLTPQNSS